MNLPRTAVAMYVALALHALLGLVLALRPAPQLPEGRAIGLVASPVALSPTEQALLTRSAPWPTDPATDTPSATTPRKVDCQPKFWPINVPKGTPVTRATVRPRNTSAMAEFSFSGSTRSVAIVEAMAKKTPWARPVIKRAATRLP